MSQRTLLAGWLLSVAALGGLVLTLHARDAAQLEALSRAVSAASAGGDRGGSPAAVRAAAPGAAPQIDAATVDAIAARVASRLHGDESAAHAAATAPAAPAEAWTADQHAALDRASQLVDRVLDGRRLTGNDMRELRHELAAVNDPGTTTEVYRRLIVALNTRTLVPDEPGLLAGP